MRDNPGLTKRELFEKAFPYDLTTGFSSNTTITEDYKEQRKKDWEEIYFRSFDSSFRMLVGCMIREGDNEDNYKWRMKE